ncbi:MAG: AmmeMemoRadiSam system protein B [Candidatus Aminicenantes bacterium]|nr:MAG: AmmeMemoRadiSam system protein B [Candidatus Aminicenantes bacterium]
MKRKPAVGGSFYPGREDALKEMVAGMVDPESEKEKAVCVVSPHAGFEYSGPVAGAVFSSVELPDKFVILGPSHRPIQSRVAIMKEGVWETPLGNVKVESSLAELIMSHSQLIEEDEIAHVHEHSLEVQLPFIQYFKQDVTIVPVCLSYHISFEELEDLGKSIARGIKDFDQDVLIVASTDMSHYVDQSVAKEKDFLAIERILELDARGLYDIVEQENISMCGFQPTTSAVVASKELGAEKASLIKYQTSGDRTGNYSEVVGYAGIRIT